MREKPEVTVAEVAAGLGYADHSHLAADFRDILGITPKDYRQDSAGDALAQ
ncbi:helix-turn-helix domain-containing protein [Corynebacterium sp. A21]|uniref:helix-turn-helix domain-containing protein n=1 Tax=Corynebacterium sp. A21 TaxID=3457318 RepID=UPI003FCFE927